MQTPLEQLETKMAWLEQANAQLSEELYRLRQQIASQQEQLSRLVDRMQAAQSEPTAYTAADEKPPHY